MYLLCVANGMKGWNRWVEMWVRNILIAFRQKFPFGVMLSTSMSHSASQRITFAPGQRSFNVLLMHYLNYCTLAGFDVCNMLARVYFHMGVA